MRFINQLHVGEGKIPEGVAWVSLTRLINHPQGGGPLDRNAARRLSSVITYYHYIISIHDSHYIML